MNKKTKNIIKYALSLAVAALLMYFCFRGVDWRQFGESIAGCRWWWVVASMLIGALANWFRSERWKGILRPIDPETLSVTTFNAVNIGYLANFVFPRIGEFVRCGVVSQNSRNGKASYDKVLGTVVTERGLDVVVLGLILLSFLALKWEQFGEFFLDKMWRPLEERVNFSLWWIVAGIAALGALGIALIIIYRNKNAFAGKLWGVCRGIWTGVVSCLKMKDSWRFVLYTVLIWACYFLTSYTSMRAMPLLDSLTGADAMFLMLAGSLAWVVPVPGGFGAFHYIVALALTLYGLPFSVGIVFATLSHESQTIMMAVTGLISYLWEIVRNKK